MTEQLIQRVAGALVAVALGVALTLGWFALTTPPALAQVANDNAANPEVIADYPATVAGTNLGASVEAGEPPPSCVPFAHTSTVWYQWTAPTTTTVRVTAAATTGGLDALLTAFAAPNPADVSTFIELACNDDTNGLNPQIEVTVPEGSVLHIRVGSVGTFDGEFTLSVAPAPCTSVGASPASPVGAALSQDECNALVDLYNATGGPSWTDQTGWSAITTSGPATDPCDWVGVDCNSLTRELNFFSMFDNNLVGPVPASISQLSNLQSLTFFNNPGLTELPASIAELSTLDRLEVSGSPGISLPPELWSMPSLTELRLKGLGLDEVPAAAAGLTSLESLSLDDNQLDEFPVVTTSITSLTFLSLDGNQIASVPFEITNLENLGAVLLRENLLTEVPPAIIEMSWLRQLALSDNMISEVPASLANLSDLRFLQLAGNQLTTITPELTLLTELGVLLLNDNQIEGLVPPSITNLTRLPDDNLFGFGIYLNNNRCITADAATKAFLTLKGQGDSLELGCEAQDDMATIVAPNDILIDVVANDGVSASAVTSLLVTDGPLQATTSVEDGKIRYQPGVSTATTDSFTYQICSGTYCDTATVTISITPPKCRRRSAIPLVATIWGTNAADTIEGTSGDDVIVSFGGDDTVNAGEGNNTVCLGVGDDTATSGSGLDYIRGGAGVDFVTSGLGIDRLWGDDGDDVLDGQGGSDRIRGGNGNDELKGGSGADRMWGGPGLDNLRGQGGQDFMWGDAGNDTMQGNFQSDRMWGGEGNDTIAGAQGKDKIRGEAGDDTMFGGDNTDLLEGGPGTDTANGQRGKDNPYIASVQGCQAEVQISC